MQTLYGVRYAMHYDDYVCNWWDEATRIPCHKKATHVVALSKGYPGDTGVMSCYRCDEHRCAPDVEAFVLMEEWFKRNFPELFITHKWDLE